VDHFDRKLLGFWQRKEAPSQRQQITQQCRLDAVTNQIEEPHAMGCRAQRGQESRALAAAGIKPAEVEFWDLVARMVHVQAVM
jgi:hypothetical protein